MAAGHMSENVLFYYHFQYFIGPIHTCIKQRYVWHFWISQITTTDTSGNNYFKLDKLDNRKPADCLEIIKKYSHHLNQNELYWIPGMKNENIEDWIFFHEKMKVIK